MLQLIYKKFKFQIRNTSFKKEIGGGFVTFFTMIYILPVNSNILSDNNEGIPYGAVLLATAIVAAIGSILVGLVSNLPIGIAPGMGSNVFFTATMMKEFQFSWETSLAIVIISSIITTILIALGLLEKFISSIPKPIRYAYIVGIGVYLAYVGLNKSGIFKIDENKLMLGDLSKVSVILALFGFFMVFGLTVAKVKMAVIYTILSIAILGLIIGQIIPNKESAGINSFEDIKLNYNQFNDFKKVFGKGIFAIPTAFLKVKTYPAVLSLIFMMLSGASSIIISVGESANLKDANNNVEGSNKATFIIGSTSILGGILGTSPVAGYIESNAGIKYGARTGIAAIFTGILFIFSVPLFPILQLLFEKSFTTVPALAFVGLMMIKNIKKIEWNDPVASASSFVLLLIMWFTSSIINGLAFGLVAFIIFEVIRGNYKKVNIYTYVFGLLFLIYIITISFII